MKAVRAIRAEDPYRLSLVDGRVVFDKAFKPGPDAIAARFAIEV